MAPSPSSSLSPAVAAAVAAVPVVKIAPPAAVVEVGHSVDRGDVIVMPLAAIHSGNATTLKLISSQNRMAEMGDMHEVPNIDVQYVALKGCVATFPAGMQLF
jgi:hypothetical protein